MFWTAFVILSPIIVITGVKTIKDYLSRDKLKKIAMKIGWNAMELCSKVEIALSRVYNTFPTLIKRTEPESKVKFIHDGNEIVTYSMHDFIKNKEKININYDFILYEIPIEKKDKYEKYEKYVLRYESLTDIVPVEYNSLKCFELNMIQINLNEKLYNIDFGCTQYIMNGNILLDRSFLKWHLNNQYGIILEKEDHYSITFIDHNMNYITLPDYCYLLIKKTTYDIVNNIS